MAANKNLNARCDVPSLRLQIEVSCRSPKQPLFMALHQNLIVSLLLKTPHALATGHGESFGADQEVFSVLVSFHSKRRVMQDAGRGN